MGRSEETTAELVLDKSLDRESESQRLSEKRSFSLEEARRVAEAIGIDWASASFGLEQFRMGMDVELEHGRHDSATNVTDDDPE